MFLNYIKEISIKNKLKNNFKTVTNISTLTVIKSVGLIIDETQFSKKEDLIKEIVANGITKDNINVIIYKDKIDSNEVFSYPTFNNKHIDWSGNFSQNVVTNFCNEKFDLLISYYDVEKPSLMLITNKSAAFFKVGFSTIDSRLNNLIIATTIEKSKIFVSETFKYLKILKKI
jgi:hypothetical protein